MTERLLQFIWQFQYYNRHDLQTTTGEPVEVLSPGILNSNQGPDFQQARLRIGELIWAGDVELHLQSAGWYQHRHHLDERYNKVVLHVVYENDRQITDAQGNLVPTLALGSRIPLLLLEHYRRWMQFPRSIPCHTDIRQVPPLVWQSWLQRLLVERLQQKAGHITDLLAQTGNHWEQVCWQLVCRYFGGPVNADSFEQIAVSLPVSLLAKHQPQLHQLEALLLGQAQLLNGHFEAAYPVQLQQEYRFLKAKYQLAPVTKPPVFLRMRPPAFPTIRLAQLAMLVHQSGRLFSRLIEADHTSQFHQLFRVAAGAFWNDHYRLQEPAGPKIKKVGPQLVANLLINVVVPLLFAYGRHTNDPGLIRRAVALLDEGAPEKNTVTRTFEQLGVGHANAATSQALLHLKNHYCSEKRCLQCAAGNAILKRL